MEKCSEVELKRLALKLRLYILKSIYMAKSGHPGSSLSCVDMLLFLYKNILNISPKYPDNPQRDRFVLSKGHGAPALYAVLCEVGFFSKSELESLRKMNAMLQGHPNMNDTPGVDMSTGSLGQGISVACGMALGLKLLKSSARVYCMLGDGELQEGQVFEALCFSVHNGLDNICFIVDNNGLQIDGAIEDVAGFFNIPEKFKAFGLEVLNIDGHSFLQMDQAFKKAQEVKGRPTAIIAKTTKGKGVYFMEDRPEWHGKAPNEREYMLAVEYIKKEIEKL